MHSGDEVVERRCRRRALAKQAAPPASREALIAGIAEAHLIERALPTLADPDAHAVTVILSRIGATKGDGLIGIAQLYVYIGSPWFDAGAHADEKGEIGP